ncbi:leucyl/phenylalanyl-tRNA--protein transferase [Kitasatospora sp. NPDC088391]|uniref:leucyl/phenylalanyl-tRNA--protein transferase n=1 Tax=Kitasatospora sp. NPDC088391 TaxID=3364074 RepID=UPI003824CDBF
MSDVHGRAGGRTDDWADGLFDGFDPADAPGDGPVAFGGAPTGAVLLAAARRGLFPLPGDDLAAAYREARYGAEVASGRVRLLPGPAGADPYALAWWCPDPRPVVTAGGVHLSTRLRRGLRGRADWCSTADRAFAEVVAGCARGRSPVWLTPELRAALVGLHRAGAAHSVEVWEGDALVGGVFGVAVGGVLSLDSMFRLRPGADRVAVADLGDRFAAAGGRLLDLQWDGAHVRALGARPVARRDYLGALAGPGAEAVPLGTGPLPVARLG